MRETFMTEAKATVESYMERGREIERLKTRIMELEMILIEVCRMAAKGASMKQKAGK